MTKFDFSQEQISIVNASGRCVDLSPQEALELLQWLSDKRAMLLHLISSQDRSQQDSARREMEILIQQEQQVHLDTLKAAIPQLQAVTSAASIFVAPADSVTEQALQLLEIYQIEYHIHPLLEDNSEFAQG